MRFFSAAISALACSVASAKQLTGQDLNEMLANGEIDKDYLLKHAMPANGRRRRRNRPSRHRRAEQNGYNQQYDWNDGSGYDNANNMYYNNDNYAADGYANYNYGGDGAQQNGEYAYNYDEADGENIYDYDYGQDANGNNVDNPFGGNLSIRFNTCMSFTAEDPNLIQNGDLLPYAQDGTLIPQQSYVLFDIQNCLPGNCVFNEDNLSYVYMVPLQTFLFSMIYYYPKRREEYCEACQEFYQYCTMGKGIYYDTAVYANGGEYCYEGEQYKMIDCHQCRAYSCYTNRNAYQDWDDITDWFNQITQCQATGGQWKNQDLYAGMMCNSQGTGVEFGIFADDECSLYHTKKSYQKTMQGNDFYYYSRAPEIVEFMFTNTLSCMADETKYITAYQPVYGEDECQEKETLNSNCQYLLEDEYTLPLSDCQANNDNENQDNDAYDGDFSSQTWRQYGMGSAQISYENAQDASTVCQIVKQTYRYNYNTHRNIYDEEASGKMFAYDTSDDTDKRQRMSFLGLIGYLVLGLTVTSLAILGLTRYYKSKTRQEITFAPKALPLMS